VTKQTRVALIGLLAAGYSGVPRYASSLLGGLGTVGHEFPDLELVLVTTPSGAARVGGWPFRVRLVGRALGDPRAGPRRILAEQLAACRSRADLLHFFDLTGPLLPPRRSFVTTLHDASGAQGRGAVRFGYKQFVQPWAMRHAAAVVAVSAFSRDEAVARFGADPRRISVIHSGPGLAPASGHSSDAGSNGQFLLYVGDLSAHKNLPFLLDVFERSEVPGRLVLAGRPTDGFPALRARIAASPASDRIVALVDAPDSELESLYRTAIATVLPSRYEGFGFTPLEAMARDCPVLASDIPALRETAGDGALLLPLDAEADWIDALQRVVGNAELRAELRRRGRAAVGRFSWESTARQLCELLLRVAR
jgi:glycosyltransferase involved in cell wall biosynthesis